MTVSHTLEVTSDYRRLDVPKIIEEASQIKRALDKEIC